MIWNGKETGKWQILHSNMETYRESFDKLAALGFVFTEERIKSADEIFAKYGFDFPHIVIGYNGYGHDGGREYPCKMIITGFRSQNVDGIYTVIFVDDWIANCWPAYNAA